MFGLLTGLLVCAIFLAALGLVWLGVRLGKRPVAWMRKRRRTPTFEEAVDLALAEQISHERNLVKIGVHYWNQQRERAVLQRIEKLMGKVATPTMGNYVRARLLQVEVVNLSPHKPKR